MSRFLDRVAALRKQLRQSARRVAIFDMVGADLFSYGGGVCHGAEIDAVCQRHDIDVAIIDDV